MRRLIGGVLVSLAMWGNAAAQQPFDWYASGPYRPSVPRPDSLLGAPIGSRQTLYHQQQQVLDRLIAAAPDRVRTEVIGTTPEGRVMRLLIISAPENLARLDQIRADLAALADPRATSPARAAEIASKIPAVAMLSHSIHGDEPAGFESAMVTAYTLLASDAPQIAHVLREVITVINPSMNPDGHERFAAWSNGVAVGSDEPASLEADEPWSIVGRFNHYRFDMNRDLIAQSQPEVRAVAAAMLRWHPQVFVDLHGTTSQYFFPPPALPVNANLPPKSLEWLEQFGRQNANAFDRFGWQYYVRDVFDLFYPGYWDSWPTLNGATGMTYETDGGFQLRLRKDDGTVTTFAEGIAHHFIASLATLNTLADHRETRLKDYYDFRVASMADVRTRPFKRVVLAPGNDPGRALALGKLLVRQGIEVTRATAPFTSPTAHDYLGRGAAKRTFPAGSLVIDLAQPQARLAAALLEPQARLDSSFAARQLERFGRNRRRGEEAPREGYEFYDITAWSLPLTYGLDAAWTEDLPAVSGEHVTEQTMLPVVAPSRAASAYVWRPGPAASARLTLDLLREGFTVGVATEPLRVDGATFPVGTYVSRVQRNRAALQERIAALALETGAAVTAVASAFPDQGKAGVGSESVVTVRAPKILLVGGEGVSHTTFGSIWFYLERELGYPVTTVDIGALGRIRLDDYNLLILPEGYGSFSGAGAVGAAEPVKRWVERGGAIIGIGNAATLLSRKEYGLTTVTMVGSESEGESKDSAAATPARDSLLPLLSASAPKSGRPEAVPGIIVRATLDQHHWLSYGYERNQLPVPINGDGFYVPSKKGENPIVFLGKDLVLSGFGWPDNTERLLAGSAWAVVENVGAGKVILFAEDPLFRGFWKGTEGLMNNALLFGPGRF